MIAFASSAGPADAEIGTSSRMIAKTHANLATCSSRPKDTLKKAENATVRKTKLLIFHDLESAVRNFSDGVSRFRRSWLEREVAVLHTDDGNEVRAGRPRTSKEEELP